MRRMSTETKVLFDQYFVIAMLSIILIVVGIGTLILGYWYLHISSNSRMIIGGWVAIILGIVFGGAYYFFEKRRSKANLK